jgi:hypothetical protein
MDFTPCRSMAHSRPHRFTRVKRATTANNMHHRRREAVDRKPVRSLLIGPAGRGNLRISERQNASFKAFTNCVTWRIVQFKFCFGCCIKLKLTATKTGPHHCLGMDRRPICLCDWMKNSFLRCCKIPAKRIIVSSDSEIIGNELCSLFIG